MPKLADISSALAEVLGREVGRAETGPLTAAGQMRALWTRRAAPVGAILSPTGRLVLLVGLIAWGVGAELRWLEFGVVGVAALLLVLVSAIFVVGKTKLAVQAIVIPPRVTAGEAFTGEISARNLAKVPLTAARLEFPVGSAGVAVDLPPLLPGRDYSEIFSIPTSRRGVLAAGPVRSVRGDPLGLLRRTVAWTRPVEVFVHPRVIPLPPLGLGVVRDLEGTATQRTAVSEFSFQSLREYVPGDDLRHVHWRSSARHGQLLVRQFLDTRRSHLTAIVDGQPGAYRSDDDYELAIASAASLLMRGLADGFEVSFLSGTVVVTHAADRSALDGCARAEPTDTPLVEVAVLAARRAPETSIAFIITGPDSDYQTLRRAASQFSAETVRVAVCVDSSRKSGLRTSPTLKVLTIARLEDLPPLLRVGFA